MVSGIYLIYSAMVMKRDHEIPAGVFMSKSINVNSIKDKDGFISYMFSKGLAFGVVTFLVGASDCINNMYWGSNVWFRMGSFAVYIVILTIYTKLSSRAQKIYILGITKEDKKGRK